MASACLSFADIFCGAGLLSYGFQKNGFEAALAADTDSDAVQSYVCNVSPKAQVIDVRKPPKDLRVDVLLAGPPCQGFSTLGRRDPKDERNALSLLIPKWAQKINAKVVVVENVPPFTKSDHWQTMTRRLKRAGFTVNLWLMDAADYETPQFRKRSFTIASRIGTPEKPEISAKQKTVRDVLFNKVRRRKNDPMDVCWQQSDLFMRRMKYVPTGGDKRDILRAAPELCPPSWFKIPDQAIDVWGRMRLDAPANTLKCCFQNPSKGRYVHPMEDRVITLREGARLQGIPDSWDFTGNRTSVARQIGNGVPIPLAQAVAKSVRQLFA